MDSNTLIEILYKRPILASLIVLSALVMVWGIDMYGRSIETGPGWQSLLGIGIAFMSMLFVVALCGMWHDRYVATPDKDNRDSEQINS